jgi:hypothetical protein
MLSRRQFIYASVAAYSMLLTGKAHAAATRFQGESAFKRIVAQAEAENWVALPIGELMGKIAMELQGVPYKANTLELSPNQEICSVNLEGLDCVTFFESTLDLARMLKKGGRTPDDLLRQVSFTRYRNGKPGDYTTRLHYTTDWFVDNQAKHVVEILSQLPGSQPFRQKVGFMSEHPELSIQLKAHPNLISKIKRDEQAINSRSLTYVPLDKLAAVEPLLKTGDIVGITTAQTGLDIAHTGLVVRTTDGIAHFMDASSRTAVMKVTLEPGRLSETLARNRHATGAMFARPLEP